MANEPDDEIDSDGGPRKPLYQRRWFQVTGVVTALLGGILTLRGLTNGDKPAPQLPDKGGASLAGLKNPNALLDNPNDTIFAGMGTIDLRTGPVITGGAQIVKERDGGGSSITATRQAILPTDKGSVVVQLVTGGQADPKKLTGVAIGAAQRMVDDPAITRVDIQEGQAGEGTNSGYTPIINLGALDGLIPPEVARVLQNAGLVPVISDDSTTLTLTRGQNGGIQVSPSGPSAAQSTAPSTESPSGPSTGTGGAPPGTNPQTAGDALYIGVPDLQNTASRIPQFVGGNADGGEVDADKIVYATQGGVETLIGVEGTRTTTVLGQLMLYGQPATNTASSNKAAEDLVVGLENALQQNQGLNEALASVVVMTGGGGAPLVPKFSDELIEKSKAVGYNVQENQQTGVITITRTGRGR